MCAQCALTSVLFNCFCFNFDYFVKYSSHAHMVQNSYRSPKYSLFSAKMCANAPLLNIYICHHRSNYPSNANTFYLFCASVFLNSHRKTIWQPNRRAIESIAYEWYRWKWTVLTIFGDFPVWSCVKSSAEIEQDLERPSKTCRENIELFSYNFFLINSESNSATSGGYLFLANGNRQISMEISKISQRLLIKLQSFRWNFLFSFSRRAHTLPSCETKHTFKVCRPLKLNKCQVSHHIRTITIQSTMRQLSSVSQRVIKKRHYTHSILIC